jgi:SAM-dependent methyltransferase
MLAIAARSLGGRALQADLRAIPLASHQLDGIWCIASLLHVPEQDTDRVLLEFRRTLRHSGSLALVTALGESSRFEPVPYAPDEERWFVYRHADRLIKQLVAAGFHTRIEEQIQGDRLWYGVLAEAV